MTQVSNLKLQNQKKIANIKSRIKKLGNKKNKSVAQHIHLNRSRQQLYEAVNKANATIAKNKRVDDIVSDKKLEMKLSQCARQLNACEINYQKSLTMTDKLLENVKNGVKSLEQITRYNEKVKDKRRFKQQASIRPAPDVHDVHDRTSEEKASSVAAINRMKSIDCNSKLVGYQTMYYYKHNSHKNNPWGWRDYKMLKINRANNVNPNTCDIHYSYRNTKNGSEGHDSRRFNYRRVGLNKWKPTSMNKIPVVKNEGFLALNDIEIDYPNSKYVRNISNDDPTMNYT